MSYDEGDSSCHRCQDPIQNQYLLPVAAIQRKKITRHNFLDTGDMTAAPSTHMFPRGCQKLEMTAAGM
jgi:hypothetical protein